MMKKPIIALAVLVIAGGLGVWYHLTHRHALQPAIAQLPPPASAGPPSILHPVPASGQAGTQAAPLPALNDSDAAIRGALGELIGTAAVRNFLVSPGLIRRIVVTVDNLLRDKAPSDKLPVVAAAGTFLAQGDDQHAMLDPQNYARYTPMVAVIGKLDMHALANVYFHFYPLFQSAYEGLGYPNSYFNDRLIKVIDSMLATPQPTGPIELVRPNVLYQYADPALEARPAGQKLLIRMGPDNAAQIKKKLSELRAALTAAPLKR
ncbi:MAG TPA: DUF3014 domain-containing protein [Steroidobacteraceae bacterium]|nr:DUF3014 domain-containing protein [Steroidobacteraceae bacterium]